MSKGLADDGQQLQWRSVDELKNDLGVDFHPGVVSRQVFRYRFQSLTMLLPQSVTKIDSSAQTVTTSSGSDIHYDHLVLAPGGVARKLPIDGKDLKGVVTLRHVEDTQSIVSAVTKDTDVVIIGTSFIGMEVSVALLKKEPKSVTLVGVDKIPFEAILGKEIGMAIMEVGSLRIFTLPANRSAEHEEPRDQILHGCWRRENRAIR